MRNEKLIERTQKVSGLELDEIKTLFKTDAEMLEFIAFAEKPKQLNAAESGEVPIEDSFTPSSEDLAYLSSKRFIAQPKTEKQSSNQVVDLEVITEDEMKSVDDILDRYGR